ncbi:beta-1,3-galactosyltransferase 4-like [Amphibalanus amphitrite]|uniref:beta-1,3-galactosyltransferase 4-like n=1 Tax=Amphibalanus amphitrite TaxID=1232801 RepID=UPI001C8FB938|nr:beta-1,3-galactosyltransferase 4-like [Amphibalanus amphitrite]
MEELTTEPQPPLAATRLRSVRLNVKDGISRKRAGFRRVSNRCMIAWIAALCFTIMMMTSISSVSSWSHTRQRTSGGGIASWLQAVKTHVRSLAALGQASSSITKPPLYPPGFQLSNLNNFTFVINNDVCGNDPVDIVMVVTSDTRRPSWRAKTRAALPSSVLAEVRVRRVFLLAELAPPDNISQEYDQRVAALQAENHEYEDLVVGNFRDAYRNLTFKHLMGLHWATAYCPQARFIAKMDHDIVVDVFQLTRRLAALSGWSGRLEHSDRNRVRGHKAHSGTPNHKVVRLEGGIPGR